VLHNAAIANHPAAMVCLRGAADENGISDLRAERAPRRNAPLQRARKRKVRVVLNHRAENRALGVTRVFVAFAAQFVQLKYHL